MEYVLGLLSLLIACFAYYQSVKTDRIVRALANLQYDEKLSMMAIHFNRLRQDRSVVVVDVARNDLSAVANVREYATQERKDRLIKNYVIPMVRECLAVGLSEGAAITVNEMIGIARTFGISVDELHELQRQISTR